MTAETLIPTGQTAPPAPSESAQREPVWVRPTLFALLAATAVLYLWGLGASGWANSFYSAAAQAGSASWKAFFFGSSDAANSITVDKTPASLWLMALSVRMFGLSSWSILVPQALLGVATVYVLYLAVRRTSGSVAGLVAGAVMASTPVAALMFRFNNPDALLTLLLTAAAYCLVRATETASTKWLAWAGVLIGFGFLTKMLQALLVVPGFAVVYLIAAPTPVRRRLIQLLAAGGALIASAGWWIAIVELTPAKYRPYIGGSQHNSILELTLGYNGFGRLTGNETGSVGGGAGGNGGMWGPTGWTRMFGTEVGSEISWLLPAALVLLVAGLWLTARTARTDRERAGLMTWGGWLLVTGAIFSLMAGIFHAYYTVALAPAIGGVVGIGSALLWRHRTRFEARALLAGALVVTAVWQYVLLNRVADWQSWLRTVVLVAGLGAAAAVLFADRLARRVASAVAAGALMAVLAGPTAYSIATAATPHSGSIPTSGPSGFAAGQGGMGRGMRGGTRTFAGQAGGPLQQQFGGPGQLPPLTGNQQQGGGLTGGIGGGATGGMGGGATGGLLNASTPSAEVVAALKSDASKYTWVAAAVGSQSAAGYQLASQLPVMAIGGFNGSDPSPTLAQFQALVGAGKIHYFIGGGGLGGGGGFGANQMGGSRSSSDIATWVAQNFTATTVGGITMYDLSSPSGGTTT